MIAGLFRVGAGAALALGASAAMGQAPPPPPPTLEFFAPTVREHTLTATCSGGSAVLAWAYDGRNATLRSFTFGGRSLSPEQLARMQGWMNEVGGDVLIDLECGGNAASMRIINAQAAGSSLARMIRANLIDGNLTEFARYNFEGHRISRSHGGAGAE